MPLVRHTSMTGKLFCFISLFIGFFCVISLAQEIKPGDTRQHVIERLGPPKGIIAMNDSVTMSYDFGEVTLHENRVVSVDFLPRGTTYSQIGNKQEKIREGQIEELEMHRRSMLESEKALAQIEAKKAQQLFYEQELNSAQQEIQNLRQRVASLEDENASLRNQSSYFSWQYYNANYRKHPQKRHKYDHKKKDHKEATDPCEATAAKVGYAGVVIK